MKSITEFVLQLSPKLAILNNEFLLLAIMKVFRIIIGVLLAALTFVYSGGITISKHYCNADLVDVAVNAEVKKCKAAAKSDSNPFTGFGFSKKSCCDDVVATFQTASFEITSSNDVTHAEWASILPSVLLTAVFIPCEANATLYYPEPPPKKQSLIVLFEQFLI